MERKNLKLEYAIARKNAEKYFLTHKERLSELMRKNANTHEREEINSEYMRLKLAEKIAYEKLYQYAGEREI